MNQTPSVNPDEMYPKVEGFLNFLARKFESQTLPHAEATSEAMLSFMKACYTYDPSKGTKFETFCFMRVTFDLKNLIHKRSSDRLSLTGFSEAEMDSMFDEQNTGDLEGVSEAYLNGIRTSTSDRSSCMEMVDSLTGDAKEMLTLLLDTPDELLEGAAPTALQLLRRVKEYMVGKGMPRYHVQKAHHEIRDRLRTVWAS